MADAVVKSAMVSVTAAAHRPSQAPRCVSATAAGEARFGHTLSSSNRSALAQRNHSKSRTWTPLVVTNAATKIKSPAEADWKTKREALLKAKVRSVSPKEALILQKEQGYTIIDVRPETEFKQAHPAGAINVQVYRLIKDWTLWDISRRVAFAFFGIFQGTEENPDFLSEVKASLDKNSKIIVACIAGGTLKPTPNLAEGSQSRSLIAAYLLTLDGFTNVVHIEGGLKDWFKQDLPTEEVVEE